jgi:hypothetical protein
LVVLELGGNPLPDPYPALLAPGEPQATQNVLAWLRGELDPAILPETDNIDVELEQRPAAFRFRVQEGKIDAMPELAEIFDRDFALDTYAELKGKAQNLLQRLCQTNSAARVIASVDRLVVNLGSTIEDVRPGVLLSRSRSIEADRNAFYTEEARQELSPDAIAMMDDVLLSLQDFLALYPVVRKIEAEQLALSIQRDADFLSAIQSNMVGIKQVATESQDVTRNAVAALTENDEEIERSRNLDVQAGLIADDVLVARNFVGAAVASLRNFGSELKEVGDKSWEAVKTNLPDGVGTAAWLLPLGGLVYLLGPYVGGLAVLLQAFKPHARAIEQLKAGKQEKRQGEASTRHGARSATGSAPSKAE